MGDGPYAKVIFTSADRRRPHRVEASNLRELQQIDNACGPYDRRSCKGNKTEQTPEPCPSWAFFSVLRTTPGLDATTPLSNRRLGRSARKLPVLARRSTATIESVVTPHERWRPKMD